MLSRLLPATAAAVALLAAPAGAASFKIVKATHTSSASKVAGDYAGSSTATWSLARPGRLDFTTMGLTTLKVDGRYSIDAKTSAGSCAWTAATGDRTRPLVAPADVTLALSPNPRTGKGLLATFTGVTASLGNAYLPSECSTSVSGEPDPDATNAVPVKPAALERKQLTLRFRGASAQDGIDYRWSTVFVLRRR